jgi:hypothetical protein
MTDFGFRTVVADGQRPTMPANHWQDGSYPTVGFSGECRALAAVLTTTIGESRSIVAFS